MVSHNGDNGGGGDDGGGGMDITIVIEVIGVVVVELSGSCDCRDGWWSTKIMLVDRGGGGGGCEVKGG